MTRNERCLSELDPILAEIIMDVQQEVSCEVICGHRNEADQNKAFKEGKSKKQWPNGEHNKLPSKAADICPLPIQWNNPAPYVELAQKILEAAQKRGKKIRWGGDWDGDGDRTDQNFHDLPHFELIN